jgi:hypothetical protein
MKFRIINGVKVHASSGNVYADLGLADAEQLKLYMLRWDDCPLRGRCAGI